MARLPLSLIGSFFLRVLTWLIPLLLLWYVGRHWMVKPPAWVAEKAMLGFFHYWVTGSEMDGTTQTLLSELHVHSPDGRVGELTPTVNILSYAYGTPLALALLLATRLRGFWWKVPSAIVMLIPFQAASICFTWLMQVAVLAGAETTSQTGFSALQVNLIAAAYQLGFLLLPTLIPVLVWLSLDRSLIAAIMIDGALSAATEERRGQV